MTFYLIIFILTEKKNQKEKNPIYLQVLYYKIMHTLRKNKLPKGEHVTSSEVSDKTSKQIKLEIKTNSTAQLNIPID